MASGWRYLPSVGSWLLHMPAKTKDLPYSTSLGNVVAQSLSNGQCLHMSQPASVQELVFFASMPASERSAAMAPVTQKARLQHRKAMERSRVYRKQVTSKWSPSLLVLREGVTEKLSALDVEAKETRKKNGKERRCLCPRPAAQSAVNTLKRGAGPPVVLPGLLPSPPGQMNPPPPPRSVMPTPPREPPQKAVRRQASAQVLDYSRASTTPETSVQLESAKLSEKELQVQHIAEILSRMQTVSHESGGMLMSLSTWLFQMSLQMSLRYFQDGHLDASWKDFVCSPLLVGLHPGGGDSWQSQCPSHDGENDLL
mmetsp:Transcript_26598/g.46898  ORF Transcript_26598/g.46898 Transcript_26598/m.46898 type:complete len:312 (-) Transcript_26598:159-1094(-)